MDIGYKSDEIFLLSVEEYEHYKNEITHESCWWWLRSPGYDQCGAASVYFEGSSLYLDCRVDSGDMAVRPALKYSNLESQIFKSVIYKDRFLFHEFPFRIIDAEKKIAIAEVPITFDMFDKETTDYETSYIRSKLLNWYETGVWER